MYNNPTFRHMRDYWLEVDGMDVHVTRYYPGTNFLITSASLEPNDEEEMEYEVYGYEGVLSPEEEQQIEQAIRDWEKIDE